MGRYGQTTPSITYLEASVTIRSSGAIKIPRGSPINKTLCLQCLQQPWEIASRFVQHFILAVGALLKVRARALHLPQVLPTAAEHEAKKLVQKSVKQAARDGRDLLRYWSRLEAR